MEIHPTAIVGSKAHLASGVKIGPYSIIGDHVHIDSGTHIGPHVYIEGHTRIGHNNTIHAFCCIGTPPQDVGYGGEDTRVIIGSGNTIREYVTINRATTKQDWTTVVGNNNYLMAYAHVAHDCVVGDHVIMANAATLGGHIHIGDYAIIGGLVAVHQFVRIGPYAFIGGKTGVRKDVPPYMIVAGAKAKVYGINRKGLSRLGFKKETMEGLQKAYKIICGQRTVLDEALERVRQEVAPSPELRVLVDFFKGSKRGVLR